MQEKKHNFGSGLEIKFRDTHLFFSGNFYVVCYYLRKCTLHQHSLDDFREITRNLRAFFLSQKTFLPLLHQKIKYLWAFFLRARTLAPKTLRNQKRSARWITLAPDISVINIEKEKKIILRCCAPRNVPRKHESAQHTHENGNRLIRRIAT